MPVDTVTITGLDNAVDIPDVLEISKRFPFVEWGILFSPKRTGSPRYPVKGTVEKIAEHSESGLRLSAHLCGELCRQTCRGEWDWFNQYESVTKLFRRVQLNCSSFRDWTGHGITELFHMSDTVPVRPFIIQHADELSQRAAGRVISSLGLYKCHLLHDASGGRGLGMQRINPPIGEPAAREGWAGGLGPDNVARTTRAINSMIGDKPAWIDMEGRVRNDRDQLCLATVIKVLERVEPYISNPQG